jgi:hypothetical protein
MERRREGEMKKERAVSGGGGGGGRGTQHTIHTYTILTSYKKKKLLHFLQV